MDWDLNYNGERRNKAKRVTDIVKSGAAECHGLTARCTFRTVDIGPLPFAG